MKKNNNKVKLGKYYNAKNIKRFREVLDILNKQPKFKQRDLVNIDYGINDEGKLSNLKKGIYKDIPIELLEYLEEKYDISSDYINGITDIPIESIHKEYKAFLNIIKEWKFITKDFMKITFKEKNETHINQFKMLSIKLNMNLIKMLDSYDSWRKLSDIYSNPAWLKEKAKYFKNPKYKKYILVPEEYFPFILNKDKIKKSQNFKSNMKIKYIY